jgi:hypothetical protein
VSISHAFMDFGLWTIAILWLCQFIASHLRTKPPKRRMPPPSICCERTGDWRVNLPSMARRQGE